MNDFGYDDAMEYRCESVFALFDEPFPPGMDMSTAPIDYRPPSCSQLNHNANKQWPPVTNKTLPPPLPGSKLPPPLP